MRLPVIATLFSLLLSLSILPGDCAPSKKKTSSSKGKTTASSEKKGTQAAPAKEDSAKTDQSPPEQAEQPPPPPEPVDPAKWLPKSKLYQAGLKAMTGHLPDVAVRNFNDLLASNPPAEVVPYIQRQLGEAYVRNKQYEEGLQVLKNNPEVSALPGSFFWEAMANKGKGSYSVALLIFNKLEETPDLDPDMKVSVLWQMAEIQSLLGNFEQSVRILQRLLESPKEEVQTVAKLALANLYLQLDRPSEARDLVQAFTEKDAKYPPQIRALAKLQLSRVLSMEGKPREALDLLSGIIAEDNLPSRLITWAHLAAAYAEITIEQKGEALAEEQGKGEDRLLKFIENEPDSIFLPEAFNILHNANAFSNPEAFNKLQNWATGQQKERTPYALCTLTRVLISKEETASLPEIFSTAAQKFPDHKATRDLEYLILQYLFDHKKLEDAEKLITLLPEGDSKTKFMQAGLAFAKNDYTAATQLYKEAFDGLQDKEGNLEQLAAFNACVSALESQAKKLFNSIETSPALLPETYSDIALEKALEAASRAEPEALNLLKNFLTNYPDHKRAADAWLTLGELALYQEKPQEDLTLKAIQALQELPLNDQEKERFARLQIILPEYSEQWSAAINAAKKYLDTYTAPELQQPMQLKLGELLYRNKDYGQALLYLQKLTRNLPENSPYLAFSLFLSGKAAQQVGTTNSLNSALELFNKVSQLDSPYRSAAIIEACSILSQQGKVEEVIPRLAAFTNEENLSPESRRLALSLEAEAWAALASVNPEALEKARKLTKKILEEPNLPATWKNKTLFQQASLAEKAGDETNALRDYHLIVSEPTENFRKPEWYWYYLAGFAAIRILEDQQNWTAAISLADSMAAAGGPRSNDAAARGKKIRLEHFVWEDSPAPDKAEQSGENNNSWEIPDTLVLPDSILPTEEKKDQEKSSDKGKS